MGHWQARSSTHLVSLSLGRVYFGRQHNTVADTLFWIGQETLIAMGQTPTDEDLAEMFLELDHDNSGGIDFPEVLKGGGARKGGKKRWRGLQYWRLRWAFAPLCTASGRFMQPQTALCSPRG